jgi:spore coat polysaccharide biosynthesis protein SpsF
MNLAVIQARMGSSRLPGKVLEPIGPSSAVELAVSRVMKANSVDKVVVATSNKRSDDSLVAFCQSKNFRVFRGDEQDVYSRFAAVIDEFSPENVLRITADCPFVDPRIIDDLWEIFQKKDLDYASVATGAGFARSSENRFPDGFDAEWVKSSVLNGISTQIRLDRDREHVTSYIWSNPDKFKLGHLYPDQNYANIRLTLDYPTDLVFIREVASLFGNKIIDADFEQIIAAIRRNSELEQGTPSPDTYNEFYV